MNRTKYNTPWTCSRTAEVSGGTKGISQLLWADCSEFWKPFARNKMIDGRGIDGCKFLVSAGLLQELTLPDLQRFFE